MTEEASSSKGDSFVSNLMPKVLKVYKQSQELPAPKTPEYVYCSDFPLFKQVMEANAVKALNIMQEVVDLLDGNTNLLDVPEVKSMEEKFNLLVDVNDKVLERVSIALDIEENPQMAQTYRTKLASPANNLLVSSFSASDSTAKVTDLDSSADLNASVKLITSKNISRPQAMFQVPVNNSADFHRPSIKVKPNAIVDLATSTMGYEDTSIKEYTHPYGRELDYHEEEILSGQMSNYPRPVGLALVEYLYVDTPDSLQDMLSHLKQQEDISIDLEHHSYRTYFGITCLMQISSASRDFVIDTLALRSQLTLLNEVFTDPRVRKIFHGCSWDLQWLQRDFSLYIVNMFDTQEAARALHFPQGSLSHLLSHFVQVKAKKEYQLADWRIRPLPEELVEYARTDTHYLLHIASQMWRQLQDRDLLTSCLGKCHEMCLNLYHKPEFEQDGFARLYRNHQLSSYSLRHIYAMEHLYSLRDSIARQEDESTHYVLPNHMFKVIVENLPKEVSGLFACCNPTPPLVRKYVYDMFKIINDARVKSLEELDSLIKSRNLLPSGGAGQTAQNSTVDESFLAKTNWPMLRSSAALDTSPDADHKVIVPVKTPKGGFKFASLLGRLAFAIKRPVANPWFEVVCDPSRLLLDHVIKHIEQVDSTQASFLDFDEALPATKSKMPELAADLKKITAKTLREDVILLDDNDEEEQEKQSEEGAEEGENEEDVDSGETLTSDDDAVICLDKEKSRVQSFGKRKYQGAPDEFISVPKSKSAKRKSGGLANANDFKNNRNSDPGPFVPSGPTLMQRALNAFGGSPSTSQKRNDTRKRNSMSNFGGNRGKKARR